MMAKKPFQPGYLKQNQNSYWQKRAYKSAKSYRPIVCLNLTYKIHTGCLNIFFTDHCSQNNIITLEQAADKKRV